MGLYYIYNISLDPISTKLFNEQPFYEMFIRNLKHSKNEVIIESLYMACRRVNELLVKKSLTKKAFVALDN